MTNEGMAVEVQYYNNGYTHSTWKLELLLE